MKNYRLSDDDIQFIAEQIMKLQQSDKPFNAEEVAQDLIAGLICCNIKNGG